MTLCTVPHCGEPARNHAVVCDVHEHRYVADLSTVPALALALADARAGQVRHSDGGGRGRSDNVPRWSDKAGAAEAELRNALQTTVRLIAPTDRPDLSGPTCPTWERHTSRGWVGTLCQHDTCSAIRSSRWPADTLESMAEWLRVRAHKVMRHEAGGELVDDLGGAVARGWRAVDRPAEKWPAGPCTNPVDGRPCGTALLARTGAEHVRCPVCGTGYSIQERKAWMLREAESYAVTAAEASRLLPTLDVAVTVGMIYGYARVRPGATAPRLVSDGQDIAGNPLYRVRDILRVWSEVQAAKARKVSA